jgi:mono/diheme cytochrome c family protein
MNKTMMSMVLSVCLAACGGASVGDCPPDSMATQSAGRKVVANRCATCHNSMASGAARAGAPTGVNYDSLEGIRLNLDSGWSETESKSMPRGGTLTADEIESVRVFLACGAADVPVN